MTAPMEISEVIVTSTTANKANKKKRKNCRLLILVAGTLICMTFGAMVGWTSPAYPVLLADDAPIHITMDQTALISGMVQNGLVFSTPLAGVSCIGSKYGVLFGGVLQIAGLVMLGGASNVIFLCVSRFMTGFGCGIAIGKLKFYFDEMFPPEKAAKYKTYVPFLMNCGVIFIYTIGAFESFQVLPFITVALPAVGFILFLFVPDTPPNLVKRQKMQTAIKILHRMNGDLQSQESVNDKIENIKNSLEIKKTRMNIVDIFKNPQTRKGFWIVTLLVTIQQWTGGPPLIVYSQIIFQEFHLIYPTFCPIVYAIVFGLATYIGFNYIHRFKRKPVLVASLIGSLVTTGIHIAYFYFQPQENDQFYTIIPFLSMILFSLLHTIGQFVVPFFVIKDLFPEEGRYTATCWLVMLVAEHAVIVTKAFQVLYDRYNMCIAFGLLGSVSLAGLIVVLLFFKETKQQPIECNT